MVRFGSQLLIELDRAGPTPLRSQLEGQLRGAIQNGRLSAGERLPSSRALADHLGVSRGLIQECYAQLQAEGYLTSRGGSATLVAATMSGSRPSPAPTPAPPTRPGLIADFQSGVPDLGLVPREDWAWAVREACRRAPNSSFDYGDPRGDPRLRDVLAAYLRRVRAVDAHADQVVVCGGFAQGLGIVLRVLARAGLTRVAFEDPGSVGTISAAAVAAGSDAVAVPVDDLGIDVDALDVSGARVVVLTPAHQWPTGVVLAAERRHRLVTWARERDAIVIEDDYDAEFRYDREPVGSLQGLARLPYRAAPRASVTRAPTTLCGRWYAPGSRSATSALRAGGRQRWNSSRAGLTSVLGGDAERFGMGPAVMLGQDLADVAGPVGEGTVADLAAGDRQMGDGHREQRGLSSPGRQLTLPGPASAL